MIKMLRVIAVASAAFFYASAAFAQNAGSVTNHAFALGKGPGIGGYTSLLCGSAQLAVGQAAADPICRTLTGDVTLNASGVTAIGTGKVTIAMLAPGTQDTILGFFGSASPSALPIANCSNSLTYSTSTHSFGCNTSAGTGTVTQVNVSGFLSGGPITSTGTVNGSYVPALSLMFGAL